VPRSIWLTVIVNSDAMATSHDCLRLSNGPA
jgi:hypothetical protein